MKTSGSTYTNIMKNKDLINTIVYLKAAQTKLVNELYATDSITWQDLADNDLKAEAIIKHNRINKCKITESKKVVDNYLNQ